MRNRIHAAALIVGSFALSVAVTALATPVQAQNCEPVICPAIVKLCPEGQIACRVSPCNCTQVCVRADRGCSF